MIGETVGGDGWLYCIGSLLLHPATMNRAPIAVKWFFCVRARSRIQK